eukprot:1715516-Pyramimonas_sp.AAC.1
MLERPSLLGTTAEFALEFWSPVRNEELRWAEISEPRGRKTSPCPLRTSLAFQNNLAIGSLTDYVQKGQGLSVEAYVESVEGYHAVELKGMRHGNVPPVRWSRMSFTVGERELFPHILKYL